MKYLTLRVKDKRKFKVTTDQKYNLSVAPDVLVRDFNADAPNQQWCGDISCIWIAEGRFIFSCGD